MTNLISALNCFKW